MIYLTWSRLIIRWIMTFVRLLFLIWMVFARINRSSFDNHSAAVGAAGHNTHRWYNIPTVAWREWLSVRIWTYCDASSSQTHHICSIVCRLSMIREDASAASSITDYISPSSSRNCSSSSRSVRFTFIVMLKSTVTLVLVVFGRSIIGKLNC